MAATCARRTSLIFHGTHGVNSIRHISLKGRDFKRAFQTESPKEQHRRTSDFAFAFDIDGVLLRSSTSLPGARQTLDYLQSEAIPFILLTNGGGTTEKDRVKQLSNTIRVPLSTTNFIQSHTPFAQLVTGEGPRQESLKDKCVLVVGGNKGDCREVAKSYGFTNVILPADLIQTFPALWPFAKWAERSYNFSHPIPPQKTLSTRDGTHHDANTIKIDAILVFNDPRDWALDTQLILDLLMSHRGYLGSISPKNGDPSLPNRGWQQDGQPQLYFSNPDLFWASGYHLPRMGQGAFREAFEGVWNAVTGGPGRGVELKRHMFGKPFQSTFDFAEKRLYKYRNEMKGWSAEKSVKSPLKKVYMIGDNPESDILGANSFRSGTGSEWKSILVRSGVYSGGEPVHKPKAIVDGVWDAMKWGLKDSGWPAVPGGYQVHKSSVSQREAILLTDDVN